MTCTTRKTLNMLTVTKTSPDMAKVQAIRMQQQEASKGDRGDTRRQNNTIRLCKGAQLVITNHKSRS